MINKLFIVTFFMLFFISCNNENEIFKNDNVYQKIVNLIDVEDQKLAFSSLGPSEKLFFWKQKFEKIYTLGDLNKNQIQFIKEIENILTIKTFEKDSKESTIFKNYFSKEFDEQSKLIFNEEQCFLFFYSFELKEDIIMEKVSYRISENNLIYDEKQMTIKECNCNTGGCKRLTGLSLEGLQWENGECGGVQCYDDGWGCGFLGLYGCANRCVY